MAVDVRHHELLVDHLVAPQKIGVARVVVDDHLVDLLQTVTIALGEVLIFHAEPPVRIAGGKPSQGGDFGKLVVVEHLEDRVVEVQPVGARMGLGLELDRAEVIGQIVNVDGRHRLHLTGTKAALLLLYDLTNDLVGFRSQRFFLL